MAWCWGCFGIGKHGLSQGDPRGQAKALGLHHFSPSIFGDELEEWQVGSARQNLNVVFTRLATEDQPTSVFRRSKLDMRATPRTD